MKAGTMNRTPGTLVSDAKAQELSERLADVFRTSEVSDVLTNDVFLDGHPPQWRFQLQGRDAIAAWLRDHRPEGTDTTVTRAIPTVDGLVTELLGRRYHRGELITERTIVLCAVRVGRICELTIYWNGDWDHELRTRHAVETRLVRP